MSSKKKIKNYIDKFGSVPKRYFERFEYLLNELKPNQKELSKVQEVLPKLLNAYWNEFSFIFYFIPEATPRARHNRFTKIFYVKNASDYSSVFKVFKDECAPLQKVISTPCKFYCTMYLPTPDNMSKVEKILAELCLHYPLCKPDWDNAGKTYSDMIQNHLIVDDCIIIDSRVRKFYSSKPRIEIKLEYMNEYDCKYNKKKIEGWSCYNNNCANIEEKDFIK